MASPSVELIAAETSRITARVSSWRIRFVDLRKWGVKRFVHQLEGSVLDLLETFGVKGRRRRNCVGVWTEGGKIASLGLRVSRGVSTHGVAVNVCNDLSPFDAINPCGKPGAAVTSLERETGAPVDVDEAADRFRLRLGRHMLKS